MPEKKPSFPGDVGSVWGHRKQIWKLVSWGDKLSLLSGIIMMAAGAAIETWGIAVLSGHFFNRVLSFTKQPASEWTPYVVRVLAILTGAYILKETLNLAR